MEPNRPVFYVSTPIYYPSDRLHIGHSYTTVAADTLARYKRMQGFDVMFLTGTDEHGLKIQRKAEAAGKTPKEYVDGIVAGIRDLWSLLDISYDRFIRTTDPEHEHSVQRIFQRLYDQGDIYKSEYEGWYCTPCEAFWTKSQLREGHCPDCGQEVELTREESYFFRLSRYQDALIRHIESHPEFIQPPTRANEMIQNFLRPGLDDLCVSRTSFRWGVPVPFDDRHVVYVWIDALSNYITALGFEGDDDALFQRYWPADVHLVGKEIVRFHTIIWPAMLLALGLPLPRQVYGHGWLLLDGGKMSKSKGNVVDPVVLCTLYGVDAIRYFLLREVPFGSDGVFSNEALIARINSDLANDLGNLVSRTLAMIERYFDGVLPDERRFDDDAEGGGLDRELRTLCEALPGRVASLLDELQFSLALAEIWKVIARSNKYIDETAPWVLAKETATHPRLAGVLSVLSETLRVLSILLSPFLPQTAPKIQQGLGLDDPGRLTWASAGTFGSPAPGTRIRRLPILFPRIDLEKELVRLAEMGARGKPETPAASAPDKTASVQEPAVPADPPTPVPVPAPAVAPSDEDLIDIDQFSRVSLRVAHVMACEPVEKSDKLLSLTLDLGDRTCRVVSGIARDYRPEALVGKRVILVANLKPARLRGQVSEGMILCAKAEDGQYRILTVEGEVPAGSPVS